VTGALYLGMLENHAVPQVPDGYILQQNGAPHFLTPVTGFLNKLFTGIWVGRGGPPRSPDLTPLELFLWGDAMYRTKVNYLPHLSPRIVDGVASVTPEMFRHIWTETMSAVCAL
jgi:hypothetical protein